MSDNRGPLLSQNTLCQWVNAKGMLELENYHFVAITVKTDSSKNHQWMLNLRGNFDEERDICIGIEISFPEIVMISNCKAKNNCGRTGKNFDYIIKINIMSKRHMDIVCLRCDAMRRT